MISLCAVYVVWVCLLFNFRCVCFCWNLFAICCSLTYGLMFYATVTNRSFVKSARGVTAAVAITYLYLVMATVERGTTGILGVGQLDLVCSHLSLRPHLAYDVSDNLARRYTASLPLTSCIPDKPRSGLSYAHISVQSTRRADGQARSNGRIRIETGPIH